MAVNVFISYAPADRPHLEALEAHLAALKRQGLVSTWHRGRIGAGAARNESIAAELSAAEVVLLLVSEAFLASDSCYERELGAALERHRRGAARVVPILVRPCDREGTALADLEALPRGGGAVTSWADPDEAWTDVVRGIRAAVEEAAASARPEAGPARAAPAIALAATLREADEAIRAIDKQIAAAQKRRVRLKAAGASTVEVDQEIVDLRRKRREGGQLHVGEELSEGRYLLLERIGRGGFATVWRALDAGRGDQPVAIKVLHPNLAGDEGRRERFFRGARAMAELDHPGVVRILEPKGEDGGWHYFVMELVHGEDVQSAVVGKRLPAERVIPMILGAGEAISFAHERGLVHRDVKPANILLDGEGLPRITDFDLVWARDTTGGTRSGALGTFLYAAPELMHRPQDADARADVYGLGMTAVFCLHGGELPPIMMRYPGRVIERLPCSDAVRKVLERAIEFEASERYSEVAAFCEALRGAAAGEGGGALQATGSAEASDAGVPPKAPEGARQAQSALWEAVRRALEDGGPIHRAINRAILEPRAGRVQGPVVLTDCALAERTAATAKEQVFLLGSWSLRWPTHPVPGADERPFEERGTFRCGLIEKQGRVRIQQVTYQSDFFESLSPWVDIPAGVFLMGSPDDDTEASKNEKPQRQVEVSAFSLCATPITAGQYAAVIGLPIAQGIADRPVINIKWEGAIEFCNALSELAGRQPCYMLSPDSVILLEDADGFRLPEEAEWEYACRAGTRTRYFFGNSEHRLKEFAWYRDGGGAPVAPVGRKKPNAWDLYDMHGNVWEWTWDEYRAFDRGAPIDRHQEATVRRLNEGARVVRGGSISDGPKQLRSASRRGCIARRPYEIVGFRCAGPARRNG
ncbi:SUMF1/EgtB/PvdO family nonheme iron enzyme [Sorangium sp. So ce861]|uniref:SUMF1/EgtB/PvdO family nonheme iron enzyme n=1 Tax=Sorangium sp. So ce861 TaxID=3133323 RepID=UPI003F5DA2AA